MMAILCIFIGLAANEPANLLHNPSFEDLAGGVPAVWYRFVQPMEGATAERDTSVAYDGDASVKIHNPEPYEREPANNWSQNIVRDLAGKELIVRGWIRTEDATHAAIWIQCCRKAPFTTLRFRSTYDEQPVYGDRDWTQVESRVRVPDDADFVTIRCVLQGEGTAWFDSIEVIDAGLLEDQPGDAAEETPDAPLDDDTANTMENEPDPPSEPEPAPEPEPEPAPQPEPVDPERLRQLLRANEALRQTLESLRETNAFLAGQVAEQQEALQALRSELDELQTGIDDAAEQASEIPPLIPGRLEGAETP